MGISKIMLIVRPSTYNSVTTHGTIDGKFYIKIESTLLTRPEGVVSVLELFDRVGVCDCSWQGVPLVDYPAAECFTTNF
ncbi:hypothetical protein BpHYR1_008458 [Brachionus plicatilis]|uniref:Uncharacterized protein n=1 Tax=Brachionus plicatilis TaxID=10195 RepID=A0A3M7QKT1_BRAPC|nr:hypothetical protein BpHYR1_008458 [Brachionus plicatilis]